MSELPWVTLVEASAPKVAVLRGLLEDEGIPTFVPDELTKLVDPFITGLNPFQVKLQVPAPELARARDLIAESLTSAGAPGESDASPEDEAEERTEREADEAAAHDPVERHARRTIVSACLIVTAPLAVVFGVAYLVACRKHGHRSRSHGAVIAALLAPVALAAVIVLSGLLAPKEEEQHGWIKLPPRPIPSPRDRPLGR